MPLFGPPDVEKLAKRRDVNGLIKALNYKDSAAIRGKAAQMLWALGGPEVIGPLINALGDVDAQVRRKVAGAFHHLKDERAIEPLIALLKDEDDIVRHFATIALADCKDVRIVKPILTMLDAHEKEMYDHYLPAVRAAIVSVGNQAIEPLKDALLHGKPKTRVLAAHYLQDLMWKPGEDTAGAAYFVALHQWDELKDFGAMAIEPLSWLLKSVDADERAQAVRCLGEIEDKRAVSLLLPMLDDPSNSVRLMAVTVLEKIDDPASRDRVAIVSRELNVYRQELQTKAEREEEHKRKESADRMKDLIRRSICKVEFHRGKASLDPGDGELTLVDLFLQDEPAIVYELEEVEGKLDNFPWSSYPVAVNFGSKRKVGDFIRNYFRCSGTFTYQGVPGIIDKRPRIYFVSINKLGKLDLHGWIEYQEDEYRTDIYGIVRKRHESVYELANYGVMDGKFDEVMQNSVYTIRLLGVDISRILSQFERHGTSFSSINSKHIIRDDNDDVNFRGQARMRN